MSDESAVALRNYGVMALRLGESDKAIGYFTRALEIDSSMVEAYIGLAIAYSELGDYLAVMENFRRGVALDPRVIRRWARTSVPEKPDPLARRPEFSHLSGTMAEFLRDVDEAASLLWLGAWHLARGQDSGAIQVLESCLRRAPGYKQALIMLIAAYFLLKRDPNKVIKGDELGQDSVLWEIAPELAKGLFNS